MQEESGRDGLLFFHFLLGHAHRAILNLIFMFRILSLVSLFSLTSHDESMRDCMRGVLK